MNIKIQIKNHLISLNDFKILFCFFFSIFVRSICGHSAECFYEAIIKTCKIKKNLNLLKSIENRLSRYCVHFYKVYKYARLTYNELEKLDLFNIKDALRKFYEKIIFFQFLEHKIYVLCIIFFSFRKNHNIIQIHQNKNISLFA